MTRLDPVSVERCTSTHGSSPQHVGIKAVSQSATGRKMKELVQIWAGGCLPGLFIEYADYFNQIICI